MRISPKHVLILFLVIICFYIASPYYASYQLIKAVISGSEHSMQQRINFISVRDSFKQQINNSFESQLTGDPLTDSFAQGFKPIIFDLVDELVKPEALARFIQTGELKPINSKKHLKKPINMTDIQSSTWFAFFDRINRFRIDIDKLTLFLEIQDGSWKLVSIGSSQFEPKTSKKITKAEHIDDEISNSIILPKPVDNIDQIISKYSNSFFIGGDYDDQVWLEGDLFFLQGVPYVKPVLLDFKAYDKEGNIVSRPYSKNEIEGHKNRYGTQTDGKWSQAIFKNNVKSKVTKIKGTVQVLTPTKMESYRLSAADIGQLKVGKTTAITLNSMANGSVTLSVYNLYKEKENDFIIIVKNKKGNILKAPFSRGSSPLKPFKLNDINQDFKARSKSISVKGTPSVVEIYYLNQHENIKLNFTALAEPEVSFGKLKTPIKSTRYIANRELPQFVTIKESVLNKIKATFVKKVNYKKQEELTIDFKLPKLPNSYFAQFDFKDLKVYKNNMPVKGYWSSRVHGNTNYSRTLSSLEYGLPYPDIDKVSGKITLKYPAEVISHRINQGDNKVGFSLLDYSFFYPKNKNILSHYTYTSVKSINAYTQNNEEIALLDNASFWNKQRNHLIFWGSPAYVEYSKVTKWITKEFTIDITDKDFIKAKQ